MVKKLAFTFSIAKWPLIIIAAGILVAQTPAPKRLADGPDRRVIEIAAKRFDFTPNSVTLKKEEPVTIRLTSSDRGHGLLVKDLGIDLDTQDGPAEVTITPHTAGRYDAICDHYCGSGHGGMKMTFVVQ